MMATMRMVTVMLLATALAGWAGRASAEMEGGAKAAFDRAMAAVAGSSMGSDVEARAMGQAIAAVRGLAAAPAIPDAVIGHVGRARAAAQAAKTPGEFLDAAKEFGEAARLAPWVAEYQFNRGVLLEKAEHYGEAALALDLYLRAAPDAKDRTEVRELIAGLRRITEKSAQGGRNPAPLQPVAHRGLRRTLPGRRSGIAPTAPRWWQFLRGDSRWAARRASTVALMPKARSTPFRCGRLPWASMM